MKSTEIQVRRWTPADAAPYQGIRLDALQCNPEAYGSTFEEEHAQPLTWFADRLRGSVVLGAFHGSELVGIAGLSIGKGKKEAHKGQLRGMYVLPRSRRAGIGRRLVESIIELARPQVELLPTERGSRQRTSAAAVICQFGLLGIWSRKER